MKRLVTLAAIATMLTLMALHVSDNTVTDNGWHGIRLGSGSTGNQVSDNTATGNGDGISFFDLFHDASSTPNTWEDNTCGTKSGADIPLC